MEKKHLTYSRRTLRQFGGVDPSIRALEKDALATSKMGFTIKDSHAAGTCYRDAQKMQKEASKRAEKHSTWLHNEESSRQDTERKMLNRSLSICMEEFDQEWKHKKVITEAHCEHLLATVRERAEAQRHYLEKKYEVERILPVKYSSATRDGKVFNCLFVFEVSLFNYAYIYRYICLCIYIIYIYIYIYTHTHTHTHT
jgi:hypothetical protein